MTFVQVRDVMKRSCRDHRMVAEFYEELMDSVDDVKLKFLLSNMKNHVEEVAHCIQEYIKVKDSPGLNSWLQYLPDMREVSEMLEYDMEMDEATIVARVNEINKIFMENYDKLSKMNMSETVTDIFIDIKKLSSHDGEREGWQKIMMNDM